LVIGRRHEKRRPIFMGRQVKDFYWPATVTRPLRQLVIRQSSWKNHGPQERISNFS
jgi:hypothetical protein